MFQNFGGHGFNWILTKMKFSKMFLDETVHGTMRCEFNYYVNVGGDVQRFSKYRVDTSTTVLCACVCVWY